MPSPSSSREILRRQLRQARRHLSAHQQSLAAEQLLTQFIASPLASKLTQQSRIALYLSNDGEISADALCQHLWQQNIAVYLPILDDKALKFARYTADSKWLENRFGIKEPIAAEIIDGQELDAAFLPLVGFDTEGGRLGMGGGFYDRTFENKQANHPPILIGLAHDCQEVAKLPIESWDVPLDSILTPSTFIQLD
ncbi:5-formyltetrahydrofolate cyclo-ligase [Marinomonas pollencensis]|uniref:5-formyltetrahydrofolate cyclo-ligase n=1 Tax=Marinomonas pollencensis TaxID=491954 RepID=A0A3E0DJG7_9GAMM|nr:5-formyltetrahydrofolate cyclo-ligase [Marinomonas pollencensis]REG82883.1 5-formyltetrahydrofolate cyclo-ligase [Marinomonas pollencensis]